MALACPAVSAAPAHDAVTPGTYESANGQLTVKSDNGKSLFEINTVGANGHTCSLEGDIHDGKAQLEGADAPCVVTFERAQHGVLVSGNDACSYWCGMRATFEGTFLDADAPCAEAARKAGHKTFQRAYDSKDYTAARAALEPLLAQCAPSMPWFETLAWRNDLAVTLYHLRDRAACLAMLEPLTQDAAESDETVREERGGIDGEVMLPAVRAARTNLKLCRSLPPRP